MTAHALHWLAYHPISKFVKNILQSFPATSKIFAFVKKEEKDKKFLKNHLCFLQLSRKKDDDALKVLETKAASAAFRFIRRHEMPLMQFHFKRWAWCLYWTSQMEGQRPKIKQKKLSMRFYLSTVNSRPWWQRALSEAGARHTILGHC